MHPPRPRPRSRPHSPNQLPSASTHNFTTDSEESDWSLPYVPHSFSSLSSSLDARHSVDSSSSLSPKTPSRPSRPTRRVPHPTLTKSHIPNPVLRGPFSGSPKLQHSLTPPSSQIHPLFAPTNTSVRVRPPSPLVVLLSLQLAHPPLTRVPGARSLPATTVITCRSPLTMMIKQSVVGIYFGRCCSSRKPRLVRVYFRVSFESTDRPVSMVTILLG